MKKREISTILLLAMLASAAASCGGAETPVNDDTTASDTTAEVTTEPAYAYPDFDGEGKDFTILNASNTYNFYTTLDLESESGETLDDAVYARNRGIEERFKIQFQIVEEDIEKCHTQYQTSILAGDYEFDAAFIRTISMPNFITGGYLYNLLDYDEFRLNEEYYDQNVNAAARVGSADVQYFASTVTSLSGMDGALCIFFNETLLEDLNMDAPYQLVRDGKWTLDKLGEYIKAGANLNGDESFEWNESGSSVYGLASWNDGFGAFIAGGGISFVTLDKDNQPVFGVSERLYNVLDKLDTILAGDGTYISQGGAKGPNGHYETIFKNGRAVFMLAELKASSKYRDMNDSFGIVPLPKYDEEQEYYSTYRSRYELLMNIPVTNTDPERAGIIMDAMAYESYTDILPLYYDYRVSQKQLRNEESIEMLDIMRSTMSFDVGFPYGWTFTLYTSLSQMIAAQSGGYASTIASYESSIGEKISSTMELLAEAQK